MVFVAVLVGIAVVTLSVVYLQPNAPFRLFSFLFPDVLFWCPPVQGRAKPEKVIALSIDDGPTTTLTWEMLDILREHDAQATFFLIGDYIAQCNQVMVTREGRLGETELLGEGEAHMERGVKDQPTGSAGWSSSSTGQGNRPLGEALIQRMHAEGHEVGNHTWYDRPSIRLPSDTFTQELLDLDKILFPPEPSPATTLDQQYTPPVLNDSMTKASAESISKPIKWFRPGGGWFTMDMVEEAQKQGYEVALGCVHPFDTFIKSPAINAWHVASRVYPGAIIVLHDGPGRDHTIPTLKKLLPKLKHEGYTITTLSQLLHWSKTGQLEKVQA